MIFPLLMVEVLWIYVVTSNALAVKFFCFSGLLAQLFFPFIRLHAKLSYHRKNFPAQNVSVNLLGTHFQFALKLHRDILCYSMLQV